MLPPSKWFVVLGPKGLPSPSKPPGIYQTIQWKVGGKSVLPLPLHIQFPDYMFALFAFNHLQPLLSDEANLKLRPGTLVERFVASEAFREVSDQIEHRGGLIWAVKHGTRPGVYTDTIAALASVDSSGRNDNGVVFQQAYAFCSFREAVVCQMLDDHPTAAIHDYNPQDRPDDAETLRAVLLEHMDEPLVKAESPSDPELPRDTPDHESMPPPPAPATSAPSTPHRSQTSPARMQNTPGGFNIVYSPTVVVHVNSPDPSSPGPSTPIRASQRHGGIERGRRTLLAEGFTMDQVSSIELAFATSDMFNDFAQTVSEDFGMRNARAADVWYTYKGRRLLHAARRRAGTGARKPWRTQTKCSVIKLTTGQKTKRKQKRAAEKQSYKTALLKAHQRICEMALEIHEQFGNRSVDLIATDIFQSKRLQTATKDIGPYHAFVSLQARRMNAELPEGEPKQKVNELSKKISLLWKEMSKEERIDATKDTLVDLRERRENKEVGEHKPGAVAAQDSFLTGERIKETLECLNMRTGDEALLIITMLKLIPDDVAAKMDGFMVTGIEGVARSHAQPLLLQLKSNVSKLITRKLQECAGNVKISRMYYRNFAERVTKRYGIVVKNWPLGEFANPSSISTMAAAQTLWNAWDSNTAHFYRMSNDEYVQWLDQYNNAQGAAPQNPSSAGAGDNEEGGGLHEGGGGEMEPVPQGAVGNAPMASTPTPASAPAPTNVSSNFVMTMTMVTDANGATMAVKSKPRKPRSDKGKPRKKRGSNVPT
ncbi:hypothetical protein BT96DRAFT_1005378 [Gymnopus androsaceus JB14]|uniref:Uncharacterized protein n=1 Tax=Gymnopus androsaceus JB14 TaxID=1447944 RepID=A0A6A4GN43_9AGAR|nr:hypothetical protein BT96DRAFT_1005378 [Gymnopus androsaceus JB14]